MHAWYGSVAEDWFPQDTNPARAAQCVSVFMLRVRKYLHSMGFNAGTGRGWSPARSVRPAAPAVSAGR
jgi:hypothetical protein